MRGSRPIHGRDWRRFRSSILLVIVGILFMEFGQTYLMQRTGQYAMFDLRRDLMAHLQRLDIRFYDRNPVGRLVTRVTTDVDVLNELFSSGLVTILGDLLVISFVVVAMFQLSPGLTLILLAVMPLVIFCHRAFFAARCRTATAAFASPSPRSTPTFRSTSTASRCSSYSIARRRARRSSKRSTASTWRRSRIRSSPTAGFIPVVEFLSMLALAMMLVYGGFRISEGALSVGILVAFFQYGMRFFRPIQDLSEKYNILQSAMAAAERVFKLLDTPVEITSPSRADHVSQCPAANRVRSRLVRL